jgi:hypothetical protein
MHESMQPLALKRPHIQQNYYNYYWRMHPPCNPNLPQGYREDYLAWLVLNTASYEYNMLKSARMLGRKNSPFQ